MFSLKNLQLTTKNYFLKPWALRRGALDALRPALDALRPALDALQAPDVPHLADAPRARPELPDEAPVFPQRCPKTVARRYCVRA